MSETITMCTMCHGSGKVQQTYYDCCNCNGTGFIKVVPTPGVTVLPTGQLFTAEQVKEMAFGIVANIKIAFIDNDGRFDSEQFRQVAETFLASLNLENK